VDSINCFLPGFIAGQNVRNQKLEGEELHSIDWASDRGQRTLLAMLSKEREESQKRPTLALAKVTSLSDTLE
jgi:hypothetical protein